MTTAEVRAVVERVVAESGFRLWTSGLIGSDTGWVVNPWFGTLFISYLHKESPIASICIEEEGPYPTINANGDDCARAVALWPEMQRLVAMLREALK